MNIADSIRECYELENEIERREKEFRQSIESIKAEKSRKKEIVMERVRKLFEQMSEIAEEYDIPDFYGAIKSDDDDFSLTGCELTRIHRVSDFWVKFEADEWGGEWPCHSYITIPMSYLEADDMDWFRELCKKENENAQRYDEILETRKEINELLAKIKELKAQIAKHKEERKIDGE